MITPLNKIAQELRDLRDNEEVVPCGDDPQTCNCPYFDSIIDKIVEFEEVMVNAISEVEEWLHPEGYTTTDIDDLFETLSTLYDRELYHD